MPSIKKNKIFNDPVYGFVTLPSELIYRLIDHPYFQRLRRIRQLGLTNLVYPGALHTRFHHAMGAMHLMNQAVEVLRNKGVRITGAEAEGVLIAILLHDIGHGPFSHALESSIVHHITHEDVSSLMIERLNKEFDGKLTLAIRIFSNDYKKKFLHQLVSSQLDMDRLDYLLRDSFFTGVSEGIVSSDRIVKMLNVAKDRLVVDEKGIYSIEKFIIARRLMYWQVYLHKTVLCAEHTLVNILSRAKALAEQGEELFCTPAFRTFLYHRYQRRDFLKKPALLDTFAQLDDYDILASVKAWTSHPDKILAMLCTSLIDRRLPAVELQNEPFDPKRIEKLCADFRKKYRLSEEEARYFVYTGTVENKAYNSDQIQIGILYKNGQVLDITKASDQLNISVLQKPVKKYFLCYPKALRSRD